jgi:hypothetical protein
MCQSWTLDTEVSRSPLPTHHLHRSFNFFTFSLLQISSSFIFLIKLKQADQMQHSPTSKTLKSRRDALDFVFIRDASALVKTDQTQPDRPCGSTENGKANLKQEILAHHGVYIITFNSDPDTDIDNIRREWRAKYATESPMFSCKSDSTC